MINELTYKDIWAYVEYKDTFDPRFLTEIWKIKSFNNKTKTAFVVFKCNNQWDNYADYTWEGCDYINLNFN